jgi:hypothetical protein
MTDTQDTPSPSDNPHPLDDLIASIRAAVVSGASADVRATGATACRSILTALEAQAGQPLTAAPSAAAASTLAGMLSAFASMPREQLLDLVIAKLRAALPPGTATAATGAPRFHLIQIPQVRALGGGS